MLNIKLESFVKEDIPSHKIDKGVGWAEWRALGLTDEATGNSIAEWFYAVACNKYYLDKISQSPENEIVGYFVQEEFSEVDLFNSALEVVNGLSFTDWDDFYKKMSEKFIYEED